MFRVWREKLADEATYLCLAEGLESLKLRNLIIDLLDMFSANAQSRRMQDRLHEPSVPKLGETTASYLSLIL